MHEPEMQALNAAATSLGGIETGEVLLRKYRVESVLGAGGMGVVIAVRHTGLGALFAMKLLLPEVATRSVAVDRFLSEARAAARLVSDHVVRVHDVGRLPNGSPYMLMEHLEGTDLAALIDDFGPLCPHDAIDYVLQALDAIVEAHSLGIVHRDLKPANLFLTKRASGRSCVKVLDFGISQDACRKGPSLTQSGGVVGTPFYMSPEQMRSAKVDHRSDIWSLGVVLYELLTDAVPFPGESVLQVCARVLDGAPISLAAKAPLVPARLTAIVERCLASDPDDRFQSAVELSDALRQAQLELTDLPTALKPCRATASFLGPITLAATSHESPPDAVKVTGERETRAAAKDPSVTAAMPARAVLPLTATPQASRLAFSIRTPVSRRPSRDSIRRDRESRPKNRWSRSVLIGIWATAPLLAAIALVVIKTWDGHSALRYAQATVSDVAATSATSVAPVTVGAAKAAPSVEPEPEVFSLLTEPPPALAVAEPSLQRRSALAPLAARQTVTAISVARPHNPRKHEGMF